MQETQLEKKVDMLRQEKKKLLEDWDLLRTHLEDWKVICKDKEEDTSDLKSQQQQVGAGKAVRLRSTTICPLTASLPIPPCVLSPSSPVSSVLPTSYQTQTLWVLISVSMYKYSCFSGQSLA